MADGDLVVANYQREFRGLLIGPTTVYTVETEEGLLATPEVRANDKNRVANHGDLMGQDYHGGRRITLTVTLDSTGGTTTEAAIAAFLLRFQISTRDGFKEYPYVFQRPGKVKMRVWARPRRAGFVSNYDVARGLSKGAAELYCTDPRVYADALSTGTITIASAANSQSGSVNHGGLFADGVEPTLQIDGPFTDPIITNVTDGSKAVRLSCTVAAGQHVLIDTKAKTVLHWNGSVYVSRYEWIRSDSRWFVLVPGTNSLTYNRTGAGTASLLTISWRNAWGYA